MLRVHFDKNHGRFGTSASVLRTEACNAPEACARVALLI